MKHILSAKLAANLLLILFGFLIVFHLAVLLNLLPSNIVWGGQAAASPAALRTLELVSLALTILFALVVAARAGYLPVGRFQKAITILLWLIFAYLLLNTLGNLAAASLLEKLIFTPLTLLAALLTLRLAIEK